MVVLHMHEFDWHDFKLKSIFGVYELGKFPNKSRIHIDQIKIKACFPWIIWNSSPIDSKRTLPPIITNYCMQNWFYVDALPHLSINFVTACEMNREMWAHAVVSFARSVLLSYNHNPNWNSSIYFFRFFYSLFSLSIRFYQIYRSIM